MKQKPEWKVININKNGEVFDPATYEIPYEGNEAVYNRLREIFAEAAKCKKKSSTT